MYESVYNGDQIFFFNADKSGQILVAVKKAVLVVFTAKTENRIYPELLRLQHTCSLFAYKGIALFFGAIYTVDG